MRFAPAYAFTALAIFAVEVLIALYGEGFVRHTLGDVLATALVYAGIRTISPVRALHVAAFAFVFSAAVEIAQALNLIGVLGLERSGLARLVLGTTFSWGDMAAYAAGACGAFYIDRHLTRNAASS